ncbi:MAG: hypothetical protein H3C30_16610 [Candidatus Hydrogenedentes bacterium]|nr:hypothetical protein [Candidatus Hydrogenedentota bacterium]
MRNGRLTMIFWIQGAMTVLTVLVFMCNARAQDIPSTPSPDQAALKGSMTGELLQNTHFEEWKGDRPVGWGWNTNQGSSAKPGAEGPDGHPTVMLVPNAEGVMDFGTFADCKDAILRPDDSLLLEIILKVDEGVPMEIRVTMLHGPNASEKTPVLLPFQGDGNWNTIQLTLPTLPKDLARINLSIRVLGAKQGTAYISFASLRVSPQI